MLQTIQKANYWLFDREHLNGVAEVATKLKVANQRMTDVLSRQAVFLNKIYDTVTVSVPLVTSETPPQRNSAKEPTHPGGLAAQYQETIISRCR
jgi:ribosomal protein L4